MRSTGKCMPRLARSIRGGTGLRKERRALSSGAWLRLNEGGRRDSARSYSAPPMKIGCPLQCRQGGDDRAGREEQLEGVHAGGGALPGQSEDGAD